MRFTSFANAFAFSVLIASAGASGAATYVYVSNAEDGTIGIYTLQPDGTLTELRKYPTGKGSNWVEIVSFD